MKKILLIPIILLLVACGEEKSDTGKGGINLLYQIDSETGCEYIYRTNTGIYPRIDKDGKTHKGCGDVAD